MNTPKPRFVAASTTLGACALSAQITATAGERSGFQFAFDLTKHGLINQRLLREGDQVSPGLTLEGIRPDGVVLNYRGRRFIKPY